LVDLVEEWEDIERYTRSLAQCIRAGASYQLRKSKEGIEIKVRVCKFGYSEKFKDPQDPELIKILAFCQKEEFIKVSGAVATDLFFT